jgi:hypothetical protein
MNERIRVTTDLQKKGIKLFLNFRGDMGSNYMDAYQGKDDATANELLGIAFHGYESQGRTDITTERVEKFIAKVAANPELRSFSSVLINIFGKLGFRSDDVQVVHSDNMAKKPSKKPHFSDHDKRGQKFGGRRR